MTKDYFWIFGHTGLGDMICCNALYRHYAELHKEKVVIVPIWDHNLAAVQWMLQDVPNIFFYPIETEQQLINCLESVDFNDKITLGFYSKWHGENNRRVEKCVEFNPVKWDLEFYRQAGLDPELKWKGFKLPEFKKDKHDIIAIHGDAPRGFAIKSEMVPEYDAAYYEYLNKDLPLKESCSIIYGSKEIHCIDSSMLNLADLMETPHCKRFVFHRYARKGLPPQLKKNWEIID